TGWRARVRPLGRCSFRISDGHQLTAAAAARLYVFGRLCRYIPIGCQTVFISWKSKMAYGDCERAASSHPILPALKWTTRFTFSAAVFWTPATAASATPVVSLALTSLCDVSHGTS